MRYKRDVVDHAVKMHDLYKRQLTHAALQKNT